MLWAPWAGAPPSQAWCSDPMVAVAALLTSNKLPSASCYSFLGGKHMLSAR